MIAKETHKKSTPKDRQFEGDASIVVGFFQTLKNLHGKRGSTEAVIIYFILSSFFLFLRKFSLSEIISQKINFSLTLSRIRLPLMEREKLMAE